MNFFFLSVSCPRLRGKCRALRGKRSERAYTGKTFKSCNLCPDSYRSRWSGKASHSLLQRRFFPRKVVRLLPDKRGRLFYVSHFVIFSVWLAFLRYSRFSILGFVFRLSCQKWDHRRRWPSLLSHRHNSGKRRKYNGHSGLGYFCRLSCFG